MGPSEPIPNLKLKYPITCITARAGSPPQYITRDKSMSTVTQQKSNEQINDELLSCCATITKVVTAYFRPGVFYSTEPVTRAMYVKSLLFSHWLLFHDFMHFKFLFFFLA